MKLSDYSMSVSRGFLSHFEIVDINLPDFFAPAVEAAKNLPGLLTSGRTRHWLEQLPELDLQDWASNAPEEQVRVAMVHYSFMVQAYVWGETEAPKVLPANLAKPMVALAERLGATLEPETPGPARDADAPKVHVFRHPSPSEVAR